MSDVPIRRVDPKAAAKELAARFASLKRELEALRKARKFSPGFLRRMITKRDYPLTAST